MVVVLYACALPGDDVTKEDGGRLEQLGDLLEEGCGREGEKEREEIITRRHVISESQCPCRTKEANLQEGKI